MSFTTDAGTFISLDEAVSWTANHRISSPGGVKAQFYGKDKVAQILQQEGCTGLRIYYAIDNTDTPVLVLIGTDANGKDIESKMILERGLSCPPNCGINSPLQGL